MKIDTAWGGKAHTHGGDEGEKILRCSVASLVIVGFFMRLLARPMMSKNEKCVHAKKKNLPFIFFFFPRHPILFRIHFR